MQYRLTWPPSTWTTTSSVSSVRSVQVRTAPSLSGASCSSTKPSSTVALRRPEAALAHQGPHAAAAARRRGELPDPTAVRPKQAGMAYEAAHRKTRRSAARARGPGRLRQDGHVDGPHTQQRRAVWALVVTLSYSRDRFGYPAFDQELGGP